MHGCSSGSALLVNAEVDSMGGVIDAGVGIGTKTSPRRAAIEKAQTELRQEYDVREERRRELEFLEKGGNPLDFKFGNAASVSVQSTSLIDQPREQFVTSEAKGSFALAASPHGDSVESSGRPGAATVCEHNSADNLLLFDGDSEFLEDERNSARPNRSAFAPSELSSQLDESQNLRRSGDSGAFGLPKNRAYKRRNRSRPNRDGARSSKVDITPRGGQVSSLLLRHGRKDGEGPTLDTNNQNDLNISNSNVKPVSPNGSIGPMPLKSNSPLDMELNKVQAVESTIGLTKACQPEPLSGFSTSKSLQDNDDSQYSQVDAQQTSAMTSEVPESVGGRKLASLAGMECLPSLSTAKAENQASFQPNGFSNGEGDWGGIPNECQNSRAALCMKGIELESSCTQNGGSLEGKNENDLCNSLANAVSNGNTKEQTLDIEVEANREGDKILEAKSEKKADDNSFVDDEHHSVHQIAQGNGSTFGNKEELHGSGSGVKDEVKCSTNAVAMEVDGNSAVGAERAPVNSEIDALNSPKENDLTCRLQGSLDSYIQDNSVLPSESATTRVQSSLDPSILTLPKSTLSVKGSHSTDALEQQKVSDVCSEVAKKAHEDSILEEAQIIEAKRKRIAQLSVGTLPMENRRKSHWDFVLEEMTWLANDFTQERLWKITAAAQLGHHIASTAQSRIEQQSLHWKQKTVAHTLAKAIREFWHSAEETSKEPVQQCPSRDLSHTVQGYALRYLKYNSSLLLVGLAEAPATPDRISDFGMEISWEDHFTEENLFYTVPPGSMETYRKSIEIHLAQLEKTGSSIQEEVVSSMYDAAADFGSQDNAYEEDEGETSTYYFPGTFEGSNPPKFGHKKRKNLTKSYTARANDQGMDFAFMQRIENKVGTQQSMSLGKRAANSLNVGIVPIKRMRTASRPRVLSPFSVETSVGVHGPSKADASSGDTNSFQDDQSTLHGGSQFPHSLEVDSAGDFDNHVLFDSAEVSKPRKKKKAKHLGSTHEQRWLHNNFQNDQRDLLKKRLDSHQLESNGSSGLFGQHNNMKKRKMMRQSLDNSFDNLTPMTGSIPSPVASQMSNMSNPNKLIKILGVRDRGRKSKSFKMPPGQPGSGSQWSLFEDQALVVLVHDLGANWELVSDAINSALQFKSVFRKPKECKERHIHLMDGTAGDGADSAEDSGTSQPYPATLPGIPKGSARQLFQRLQGPMEEDMIKSHFEQIIMISRKQHYRRTQNDNQDQKPSLPHSSHALALSQVSLNNLNGGPPLTPVDLADAITSSPDILPGGYQGSHASGLAMSNQGSISPIPPTSGSNSSLQVSSNMALGNSNFSSPSAPPNVPIRDGRYGLPRSASLATDEQQRMQQYNHVLSGRNLQQSGQSVSGAPAATDRGVRMLPNGSGVGTMGGVNRSMPMARPGFQGITPSSVLNPGSMLSSNMAVMPNPANAHLGIGSGQGNSMLRPRDALNMMRPGQNPEHQRQMMVPELQMQVTQGTNQGVPPFAGLSATFSNQTSPPPVHAHPLHQQQQHQMSPQQSRAINNPRHPHIQGPNHAPNPQHQAYARYANQRQLQQQRLLQQQQQQQPQYAASNQLMPHVQAPSQLPVPSSLPNSSQIQAQNSSAQHQQKLHIPPPHGLNRIPQTGGGGSGSANQLGKQQRQRPLSFQQSGNRHHPQQRQQSQSQQQAKLTKGGGRGNMLIHPTHPIDPSLLNGLSTPHGSQSEPCLYPGPVLNHVQPPKPSMPPHSPNMSHSQQKMFSGQPNPSSNQVQQMPSHLDTNQGHTQSLQPQHKLVNQTPPNIQRVFQQNHQLNSNPQSKSQADQAQNGQQPPGNSSQLGTMATISQSPADSATVMPVVPSSISQWKPPEQIYDSGAPNLETQIAPIGSSPVENCSGSEPMPAVSLGVGHGQHPSTPPPLSQLQQQSPQKLLGQEQQQSQRQEQHLQAGKNSLYIGPSNSRLD